MPALEQFRVFLQVWCAIATYVLIAIVKKELHLKSSLYTCLQILSVSVFEKTLISCALQTHDYKNSPPTDANQLILLGFLSDSSGVAYGISSPVSR